MKIIKASGFRGVVLAATLFSVVLSARAVVDNTFIYQEGVFQKESDCWFQAFTLTGSASQAFVLRFASDYACDAAIVTADQLVAFTNNLQFTGKAVLDSRIGTQSATLPPGTYYVCARAQSGGENRYRVELDRKIELEDDDEFRYSFADYYLNTSVYLAEDGGLLTHPFTIQAGVCYLFDGCNTGVETYIIPESALPALTAGGEFDFFADYSDPGANGASPGLYEINLPPGNYVFVGINRTAVSRALVYTLERWIKTPVPFNVTVSFDAQGGSVSPQSKTVKRGSAYGALPTPTRAGYSFGGWWTEAGGGGVQVLSATVVTASTNHTLFAFWTLIAEQIIATASPLPSATVGNAYGARRFSATGGQEPYRWTIDSGVLPDGLSLSEDGVLSGTPETAGIATFTVRVTGANDLSSTKSFSLTVEPHPVLAVTPASHLVGKDAGSVTFGVTNAAGGELTWSVSLLSGGAWVSLAVSDGLVKVTYSANPSGGSQRTAVLRVTAEGATGSPAEVSLTQAANTEVPTYGATVGVAFECDLGAITGGAAVSVKGLPSGLKYNPTTRRAEGVPAKAGEFTVQVFASGNLLGTFRLEIAALPAWAQGAFNGYVEGGGLASMSVTAAGKVSGKIAVGGTNYTFGAASFAAGAKPVQGLTIEAVAKAGKTALPLTLTVTPAAAPQTSAVANGSLGGARGVSLWRDVWSGEAARLAPLIGYYTATLAGNDEYGSGYLTLTVDKAAKVKVGGKLADGTAVSFAGSLILDASNRVFAAVYAAPKTYGGGCLFGLVELVDPGSGGKVFLRLLEAAPFAWRSLNPQAAAVYGAGFDRAQELAGGWYSKSGDLGAYYAGRNLTAGADTNAPAPELTVGAARYDAMCWNPSGVALTPTGKAGAMTGLVAPVAGKPVDPDKDGVWDYSAANSVGLKISLARPTGIFKGSFLAWFDYPEKKHVSKSLAFEGALTPVREDPADGVEGRGFFLWADKVVPPAPARPYAFKWSYDFLLFGN